MSKKPLVKMPIRLAMRHEGNEWVAYLAGIDNMKRAFRIGSIQIRLTERPERKQAFLALMTECMLDQIELVTGKRPKAGAPYAAPEAERSGHA